MQHHELTLLHLQRKMSTLAGMLVSLEEYRVLAKSGLSRQAASVVATDVLRVSKLIGDTDVASLEAYVSFDKSMSMALGMEDASAIGAKIAAAIKAFKEWLKDVYALLKEQVGALLVSFGKLRAKIDVLKGTVKSVPDTPVEVHIPSQLANKVAIQGDLNQGHFPELRELANFGAVAYPEALNDFYLELAAVVKNFDPSQDATTMVAAIEESLKPLNFTNVDNQTYPGNVMIVHDDTGYNYSIAEIEARIVDADITRKSRTSAEFQHDLLELVRVIDIAEKLQEVSGKIETSVSKVVEATDDLEKSVAEKDDVEKQNASAMISSVLSTTTKVKASNASIIRYLGRVIETHLQIMELEVKTATNSQRA